MIQSRVLQPVPDLCCLPSPHRIPQSVAGMAFNFSKIELSHHSAQRKLAQQQDQAQLRKALLTQLRG
jgi:hypothetical protein